MSLELLNRDPEPGETQVPVGTDISLDIADKSSTGVEILETEVFVNGVLAFDGDGGGFQAGFTGPNSATSSPDANTLRVVIDPTTDFSSEQQVSIQVTSDITGLGAPIDETYEFTVEDITAPVVDAVNTVALDKDVLRVVFNEPVLQVSAANNDDALNPANYSFARQTAPAANVVAASVVSVTDSVVDVIFDIEMTPGASYLMTISNVEDLFGNTIISPGNQAEVIGFLPDIPAGRRFNIYSFLPQINRTEDVVGDLLRFTSTLQETLDLVLCGIDRFPRILDPDTADEDPWLDLMLCDLGNPFNFQLTEVDKRRLIQLLVDIYKQKGTCNGIINAVRFFLGLEVDCDEFLDPDEGWILGEDELGIDAILGPSAQSLLYSFNIISPVTLTQEQRDRIREICDYMRPAHTHCLNIIEPTVPEVIDHLELGLSELGLNWQLH